MPGHFHVDDEGVLGGTTAVGFFVASLNVDQHILATTMRLHDTCANQRPAKRHKKCRILNIVLAGRVRAIVVGPDIGNRPSDDELAEHGGSGVDFGEFRHGSTIRQERAGFKRGRLPARSGLFPQQFQSGFQFVAGAAAGSHLFVDFFQRLARFAFGISQALERLHRIGFVLVQITLEALVGKFIF